MVTDPLITINSNDMTNKRLFPALVATLALLFSVSTLAAQYDDIYYNPDQDYDNSSPYDLSLIHI